jgi:hypothetical protein
MAQLVERETQATAHTAHYMADYERTGPKAFLPAWLREARHEAITHFDRLGFPTTRLEEWKFTSVAPIAERAFALAEEGASRVSADDVARLRLGGPTAAVIVCVNGRYAPQLSSTGALPGGVRITGLASALVAHPDALEHHLARLAPTGTARSSHCPPTRSSRCRFTCSSSRPRLTPPPRSRTLAC